MMELLIGLLCLSLAVAGWVIVELRIDAGRPAPARVNRAQLKRQTQRWKPRRPYRQLR